MARDAVYEEIVEVDRFVDLPVYQQYESQLGKQHVHQRPHKHVSFGKPGRKARLELMDLLALLLSLTCLATALCSISPRLKLAWYLGYTTQLIVIGFLLSIMNLALNRTVSSLLVMVEARFGPSTIQNYEALLYKRPLARARISTVWRIILLLLVMLPLGLSAGYKRYFGGLSTVKIPTEQIPHDMYGTTALPGLNRLGDSIGYAQLVNATLPFAMASAHESPLPSTLPQCYGQNSILLSNTSAAFLDLPMPNLVDSIQQSIGPNEKKTLSAQVHAFVTTYNESAEQYRSDDEYWDTYSSDDGIMETSLFTGYTVYTMMNLMGNDSGTWIFVAMINTNETFRDNALRFDTYRHLCNATWDITTQSMELIRGSCDPERLPDDSQAWLLHQGMAVTYWYNSILADNIGPFSESRQTSLWRMPTYVFSIASMYWARYSAFAGPNANGRSKEMASETLQPYEYYYHVPNHTMVSTKTCIDPRWSLYCILILQPLLTVLVLISKLFFDKVPVGEGFGLVTILAGLSTKNLGLLRGASLTGELTKPVRLAIGTVEDVQHESFEGSELLRGVGSTSSRHVVFEVGSQERNGMLSRGKKYQ